MKILYITNKPDYIEQYYKEQCKKSKMAFINTVLDENFVNRYKYTKNCLLCVRGLEKRLKTDILLKVLEQYDNNIVAIAETNNINTAIMARFDKIEYKRYNNTQTYQEALKNPHDNLEFYVNLANAVIYDTTIHDKLAKLQKINEITKTIQLCTNNILWESLYGTLIYG